MLLLLMVIMLLIAGCTPSPNPTQLPTLQPSVTPTALPVLETLTGSLGSQVGLLEANMPRSSSEIYVVPSHKEQAAFSDLVTLLTTNKPAEAVDLAKKNNYKLSYYVDRADSSSTSYLLQEQTPIQKGWGLYALRLDSTSNIIIEAPHPLYDINTPSIALDLYRALDARALLIAGAHRHADRDGSADVAHAPESIFQAVHLALLHEIQSTSGDVIILQIHGFHTRKHKGYPQVVFGLGTDARSSEIALAQKIKDALAEHGISAGICAGSNGDFKALCANTNVQGASMSKGEFMHIELDRDIRNNDEEFVAALVQVFGQ